MQVVDMGTLIDSEKHITDIVKQDKEFFRVDKMYCEHCKQDKKMLLECFVKGSTVILYTNWECGENDKFEISEKTLLKQMFEIQFKECLYFRAFRVCYFYNFFVNEASRQNAVALIHRLEKKFKKWNC